MKRYADMTVDELQALHHQLEEEYQSFCSKGLDLNMARGKPGADQLALSAPMLDVLDSSSELFAEDGTDCRNYGVLTGIPEAKKFIASMLGTVPEQVIVFGNASLNIEYDMMARAMIHGVLGATPWCQQGTIKFLCPAPGYDRHFAICEAFGIEMITINMTPDGPDMDTVEQLVSADEHIKGMWCVPMYSNPQGYTYSDETVRRIAALKPAADDFRVFWDNAYCVHHLYEEADKRDTLLEVLGACAEAGNPELVYEFCSTSKITFPGSGIAALASGPENIASVTKLMGAQTIGHDKINQLRHVRFLKDKNGLEAHMMKHAALLRPKFEAVLAILEEDLASADIATWAHPRGGYFISFEGPKGSARKIVEKASGAGVKMTGAGATYPYGKDPMDSNIRIAPSFPSKEELEQAARVFTLCVRLVAIELLLENEA